jgi:hypothetical protein
LVDTFLHFVTFADGNVEFRQAGLRIVRQAAETNLFKSTNSYDIQFLKTRNVNGADLIDVSLKGLGFWVWKPLLINYVLENVLSNNEILIYCDAGSEIVNNTFSRRNFAQLLANLERNNIIAFNTSVPEFQYTKKICLDLLTREDDKIKRQVAATLLLIKRTDVSREFISTWASTAVKDHGQYINDSLGNECSGFREHRYDQSIFSVLYKNQGYTALELTCPRYNKSNPRVTFKEKVLHNNFFFWLIRNRTGQSSISNWQASMLLSVLLLPLTHCRKLVRFSERYFKLLHLLYRKLLEANRGE